MKTIDLHQDIILTFDADPQKFFSDDETDEDMNGHFNTVISRQIGGLGSHDYI